MPYVLENAIRAAVGQRGVAVVVIPGDVALKPAPAENFGTVVAGILISAPVFGLLPVRTARVEALKEPKPARVTWSPWRRQR